MLLLDSVQPEKWYKVHEAAEILGWAHDTIERWIDDGLLQAFMIDLRSSKRKRVFRGKRVQGCEIIRFAKDHLTPLKPGKFPRFRTA
jgi:hypothetical protein